MAKRPKKTLVVKFGSATTGKTVGRIGISISRGGDGGCELDVADELFTDTRLTGVIEIVPKKAAKGQKSMLEDQYPKLEGTFDVKGFRTNSEHFSCGLTFNRKSIDVNALGEFAGQVGKLSIMEISEIPEEDAKKADAEEGSDEEDQVAEDED